MAVMEIPVVDPIALNRTLERLEGSDPPSGQNVQLRLSGTVYVFA